MTNHWVDVERISTDKSGDVLIYSGYVDGQPAVAIGSQGVRQPLSLDDATTIGQALMAIASLSGPSDDDFSPAIGGSG